MSERTDEAAGPDRDHVVALARGLEVLRHCTATPDAKTPAELARATGLSRATVRRSLMTLRECGYLAFDGRTYAPTPKVLALTRFLAGTPPTRLAQPILDRLSQTVGESVSLATLQGDDVVYIARAEMRRILSLELTVGSRLPAASTSLGRVLLAALPAAQRASGLQSMPPARTPRAVTDRDQLLAILERADADGFCILDQELELGLRSLAIPVPGLRGGVTVALNVSTQTARTSMRDLKRVMLPALQAAARELGPLF